MSAWRNLEKVINTLDCIEIVSLFDLESLRLMFSLDKNKENVNRAKSYIGSSEPRTRSLWALERYGDHYTTAAYDGGEKAVCMFTTFKHNNMKIVGSGYLKLNFLMGLMIGLIVYLTKIFIIVNMLNLFLVKIVLGRDPGLVGSKEICLSRILIGLWVNYYV